MASSGLSTITLRSFYNPPHVVAIQPASPSLFSPKQFPLQTPKLSHRSTFLRPVAAVAQEKVVELGDEISNLTLSQAQSLVEYLQDKLGVTFVPAAVVAASEGAEADAVEEKTGFDVVIDDIPNSARILTIKVLRGLTSLGIMEVKKLIERLPNKFMEGVSRYEAADAKKRLEEAGAKVSIV